MNLHIHNIDLFSGEHLAPEYNEINPNHTVPALKDGGFILTESVSILRFLADRGKFTIYPRDIQERIRVDQWLDWFNTLFMLDFVYGLVYARVLPWHRLTEAAQAERLNWHEHRARKHLSVLNNALAEGPYVLGSRLTIADYYGVCLATTGEFIDFDFSSYPHVGRWIAALKALPAWDATQGPFYAWVEAYRAQTATA